MGIDYQNYELALKGQCHEIFNFSGVFNESVSPKPLSIPLGPFRIFPNFAGRSSRCTTGVVDTNKKWKKSSIIKVLIFNFHWTLLGSRVNI
jgi:hypothetical protein